MILRQALGGTTRFDDFQKQLGISRNLLTARLKKLVKCGILQRRPVAVSSRRFEYVLTDMGEDLFTTIIALRQWGERWLFRPLLPPFRTLDASDDSELEQLKVRSLTGRELRRADIRLRRRNPIRPAEKSGTGPKKSAAKKRGHPRAR
jgi:DNA-binding HxlR family transcriptional regulator